MDTSSKIASKPIRKLELCLVIPIGLFKGQYMDILFWLLYSPAVFLDSAIFNTFCRRKKYSKTPLQIYEAIFATQNRSKNSPITHKAHYAALFLELLLNRFAFKKRIQKHIAIVCKRTKGIGIAAAQLWRRSFISGAYEVSNCCKYRQARLRRYLMFLKSSFGTPFCAFQKVSKDAMKQYYSIGYESQNRMAYVHSFTYTVLHRTINLSS